ncbi:DNA repair protein RecO [Candidatus Neomarinimicrobiota bacterium]
MIVQTPAIVLKSFPYGDSSLIVRCYTRDQGKVNLIIKGARRKKSSMAAYFQPINHIDIIYYHKDTREIQTVSKVAFNDIWTGIGDDLKRIAVALSIIELTDKTNTNHDPHSDLFDLLLDVLRKINLKNERLNLLFWYFQIQLLSILGFKPNLDQQEFRGMVLQDPFSGPNSGRILMALRDGDMDSLSDIQVTIKDRKVISEYLTDFLRYHFDSISELKSLKILKQMLS